MVADVHEFVAAGTIVHNCVWAVTQLMGGAQALAFLSQLSANCPECRAVNSVGRPTYIQCGAPLPFAEPVHAAALPDGFAGAGAVPVPDEPEPAEPTEASEVVPDVPAGATVIAGLILP